MPAFWEYLCCPRFAKSWPYDLEIMGQSQKLLYSTNLVLVLNICSKYE